MISVTYNSKLYIYLRNVQNDIIGLIDPDGNVVVKYTYDSWGNVVEISGTGKDDLGVKNPFRYRGYYYDTETGMYYLKSRYYDPELRRFISADTVVSNTIKGMNVFTYCENNPINMVDYNGHIALEIGLVGILGSLLGTAILNSSKVKETSRNVGRSVSKTIVKGLNSATDYFRESYQQRVEARMKERLAKLEKLERKKQIHHIVAQKSPMAQPARRILAKVNIDVGSPINLVALSPEFHMRLHTNLYYGMINLEMIDAYYHPMLPQTQKGSVIIRLNELREYLLSMDAA